MSSRLLLIRHGQSTWNAEGRWQGQADPPLSSLGVQQAQAARDSITQLNINAVVASDLERARHTAELIAPPELEISVHEGLRERHAGEWTGLTHDEIDADYPDWIENQRRPPGFEKDEPLLGRVIPVLVDLAIAAPTTLVVTHGGVIRSVEHLLSDIRERVPNLGGRWIRYEDGEFVLEESVLLFDPNQVEFTVPDQI